MKRVILGVSSGIAAFKSLELITILRSENLDVHVIMTEKATNMVSAAEFEQASGNKVHIDLFESDFNYQKILQNRTVDHINLADSADIFVIVPATANTIAKIAHGIADDFLTTTLLATTAPVIVCPAMNVHMWENPIVAENIQILRHYGFHIIPPAQGMLACGYEGVGKLEDIHTIKTAILQTLKKSTSLKGKKILITAGGTSEQIDAVRYITNRSSGKMGIALAEACFKRGAEVTLLHANSSVKPRFSMKQESFETADELQHLIERYIPDSDVMFHTAAVSDFYIEHHSGSNNKKLDSTTTQTLQLTPRKKILDTIKIINPRIQLIAFKAESGLSEEQLMKKAQLRLNESNADFIIANDVGNPHQGFSSDINEVFIIGKNTSKHPIQKIPLTSKREVAENIIDSVIAQ